MKALSYLNKYFLKYKWHLIFGILFIVGTNLLKAYLPLFFQQTMDDYEVMDPAKTDVLSFTTLVFLKYMGIALGAAVFLFLTRQAIIMMSRRIEFDLKNEIQYSIINGF